MHDNQYPDKILEKPWQTPATIVHSWGWHAKDYSWKPAQQMIAYLVHNTSKGGNYLLNVGPKPDGSFPVAATRRLREIGAWMLANGESVYGSTPVREVSPSENVAFAQKTENGKRVIYVFMTGYVDEIELPFDPSLISSCTVLESGMPLTVGASARGFRIQTPGQFERDGAVQVFKVTFK
jgi:alpha-L-fucosidase